MTKWKKTLLSIAIAIVLVGFVMTGIQTFYPSPENNCYDRAAPIPLIKEDECSDLEGSLREDCLRELREEQAIDKEEVDECFEAYRAVRSVYNRNVFIVLTIIGALSIIIGVVLKHVSAVYYGLMIGGIVNIFAGIVIYWSDLTDYIRFTMLGVLLAVLIYVAYRWLRD